MDSKVKESCTNANTTQVFEVIITNPCSEPSEPLEISCAVKDFRTNQSIFLKNSTTSSTLKKSSATNYVEYATTNVSENAAKKKNQVQNYIEINLTKELSTANHDTGLISSDKSKNDIVKADITKNKESQKCVNENIIEADKEAITIDSDVELCESEQQIENPKELSTNISKETAESDVVSKVIYHIGSDIEMHEEGCKQNLTIQNTDADVIVLDSKTNSENTIILDENEINKLTEKYPAINLDSEGSRNKTGTLAETQTNEYNNIFKEHPLLSKIVEKCLSMENNGGMSRVINHTLLSIYKNVREDYKKTDDFKNVLTKTLNQLDNEPAWKYSHIKCLCDHLKLKINKRRATLVTLESSTDSTTTDNKKRRVETIDLDNYSGSEENRINAIPQKQKEYPPIEIDDDSSIEEVSEEVVLIENNKENRKRKKKKLKKKKNLTSSFNPTLVRNPFCTRPVDSPTSAKESETIPSSNTPGVITPSQGSKAKSIRIPVPPNPVDRLKANERNKLLGTLSTSMEPASSLQNLPSKDISQAVTIPDTAEIPPLFLPIRTEPVPLDMESFKPNLIKSLEEKIAMLSKRVELLDEMEVTDDSMTSPYIISQQIQRTIAEDYKSLCELTGSLEKKQHKVRLQALPGYPVGPVRCLEDFLNSNIDEDGNPPFPDIQDVIQCVCKANSDCGATGNHAQVMTQARALFVQFGRTMQRRRQKREWKDLMDRVKEEVVDPADDDPELMMKLNRNSVIAKRNEDDLLQRYANMESKTQTRHNGNHNSDLGLPTLPNIQPLSIDDNDNSETDSSDNDNTNDEPRTITENTTIHSNIINENIVTSVDGSSRQDNIAVIGNCLSLPNSQIVIIPTLLGNNIIGQQYLINNLSQTLVPNSDLISSRSIANSTVGEVVNETINSHFAVPEFANLNNLSQNLSTVCKETSKEPAPTADISEELNIDETNTTQVACQKKDLVIENNSFLGTYEQFLLAHNNKPSTNYVPNFRIRVDKKNYDNKVSNNQEDVGKYSNELIANNNTTVVESSDLRTPSALAKNILQLILKDCPGLQIGNKENQRNIDNKGNEISKSTTETIHKQENNEIAVESKVTEDNTGSQTVESNDAILDSIKPEPLDIPRMLDELGEDFTTVVFDIEDPFLIIDISDSSESEEDL